MESPETTPQEGNGEESQDDEFGGEESEESSESSEGGMENPAGPGESAPTG